VRSPRRGCRAALLLGFLIAQFQAGAAEFRAGHIVVADPWSRPTPPTAAVGAVYFAVTNAGPEADRLVAVSSPLARRVEIHESRNVQGVVQMRPVTSVDCPPGATVKSEPGGLHVMLVGLKEPLAAGTEFPLSLEFRDAGVLKVEVRVENRQ